MDGLALAQRLTIVEAEQDHADADLLVAGEELGSGFRPVVEIAADQPGIGLGPVDHLDIRAVVEGVVQSVCQQVCERVPHHQNMVGDIDLGNDRIVADDDGRIAAAGDGCDALARLRRHRPWLRRDLPEHLEQAALLWLRLLLGEGYRPACQEEQAGGTQNHGKRTQAHRPIRQLPFRGHYRP